MRWALRPASSLAWMTVCHGAQSLGRPTPRAVGAGVTSLSGAESEPMGAMAGFGSAERSSEPMGAMAGFESSAAQQEPMGAMAGFERPLTCRDVGHLVLIRRLCLADRLQQWLQDRALTGELTETALPRTAKRRQRTYAACR